MKSRNNKQKSFSVKKIYFCFAITYCVFSMLFWVIEVPKVIVCLMFFILFILFAYFIRKQLLKFVLELESIMDSMIEGVGIEEKKITYKDNLFSKVMHKLWKMNSIQQHMKVLLEEEKNEIKKMVSDIAHQVKTPMTNVKMYHEILLNQLQDEEEYKETIYTIQSQVNKLDFLIQSILKISELEIGIIDLNQEKNLLRQCLMKALENVALYAKLKNIEINVHDKMDLEVYCDMK